MLLSLLCNQKENIMNKEISEKEWELLEAIRNYKRAYPNGRKNLRWLINEILAELMKRD